MSIKIMTEVWDSAPVEGGSLLVLLALADSSDDASRTCYPGVGSLAKRARLSERQVIRCIRDMSKIGVISVRRNASPIKTNLYYLTPSETWRSDMVSPTSESVDVTFGASRCDAHVISDVTPTSPKPSVTSVIEPSVARDDLFSADEAPAKRATDDEFDRFWKVYPKKSGKIQAKAGFARAVKSGADPKEIIAGAARYADAMAGTELRFVKMAQGWLTDERWTEAPQQSPPPSYGGHRMRPTWDEVVR